MESTHIMETTIKRIYRQLQKYENWFNIEGYKNLREFVDFNDDISEDYDNLKYVVRDDIFNISLFLLGQVFGYRGADEAAIDEFSEVLQRQISAEEVYYMEDKISEFTIPVSEERLVEIENAVNAYDSVGCEFSISEKVVEFIIDMIKELIMTYDDNETPYYELDCAENKRAEEMIFKMQIYLDDYLDGYSMCEKDYVPVFCEWKPVVAPKKGL